MPDEDEEGRREPTRPTSRGIRRSWLSLLVVGIVVAVILGGIALGVAVGKSGAAAAHPASCGPSSPKLTVHGTGVATAAPDLLTIVVQVTATGPSAAVALATDNTKATVVVTALQNGGAQASDIQTSDLSVQPQYVYPKGIPTVSGYQVDNTITATLHDIATSGSVIDAVVGAAGNAAQIESLSFSTRDTGVVEARCPSPSHHPSGGARPRIGPRGWTIPRACVLADGSDPGVGARSTDQRPLVCLGRRRPRRAD